MSSWSVGKMLVTWERQVVEFYDLTVPTYFSKALGLSHDAMSCDVFLRTLTSTEHVLRPLADLAEDRSLAPST